MTAKLLAAALATLKDKRVKTIYIVLQDFLAAGVFQRQNQV